MEYNSFIHLLGRSMSSINNNNYSADTPQLTGAYYEVSFSDSIPKNLGSSFLQEYEMQESARKLLGRGQFKAVYLLTNPDGKQITQQQVIESKYAAKIEQTARSIQALKLPNIVKIRGIHKENESLNIMTKYYNLGDLETYIKDLPYKKKLTILIEACKAVRDLNERGIEHRDIKASNFLVHEKKNHKIQVVLSDPDCIQGKVRKNKLLNVLLAPPELLDSNSTHDIWMCGLMVVMTLTGMPEENLPWYNAFNKKNPGEVKKLKQELPQIFDSISNPTVKAACLKAMHPENTKRGSIGALIASLQQAIDEPEIPVPR
jgi:serine/threonine protein kinase